ncbi:Trigger factor-like protein TIG Chloroplastic [Bienertia sinuspersici]
MSMKFCSSAFSLNLSIHAKPSSSSLLPTNHSHSFNLNKTHNSIEKFLQFSSSSSRQLSALQHSVSQTPTHLAASSSSTVNVDKEDKLPADIDVTEIREPNSRVKLSVNVPPVVCDDCYKSVMREISKQAKVPGFRPGKQVPDSVLISYAGKQNVNGMALQDSVRITTSFSEMEKTYASSNSLKFDVVVDVLPEVRWVPENGYKNLKIVVEVDNEITAELACERELRRRHKALGFNLDTEDAENVIPGFLDSIIGIRAGETKSFPLVFPESWKQEDLRGVQAQFTVDCKELFYRDLPPLDDSLAEQLLSGCSTLDEVKEALLQRCRELEQKAKEQAADNAILDQLRKAQMKLSDKQLASLTNPNTLKEYIEHEKENITQVIKQNLAVGDIFKRENLQVSTDEVVKEVQEVLEGAKVLEWVKEHADIQYVTR